MERQGRKKRRQLAPSKDGRIVEASNSFTVKVLLDGRKHPITAHHMFFEKAGRKG
jgi:hypothetical protein